MDFESVKIHCRIIDRENKSDLKKLKEAMERIEGEPYGKNFLVGILSKKP